MIHLYILKSFFDNLFMKKAFKTLALCLGLACNSISAGNPEYRSLDEVASITNRQDVIKSSTSGRVDLPMEIIKDYLERPVFSGKVLLCLGKSPYYVYSNQDATIFYDHQGHTSVYNVVRSNSLSNKFEQVSRISGNRFFGKFDSLTFLSLQRNPDNTTQYANDMYVNIENRFFGSVLRGLMNFPIFGEKLKKSFEDEQDGFVKSVKKTIDSASKSPEETINKLRVYTNETLHFSSEEVQYFKESLEKINLKK